MSRFRRVDPFFLFLNKTTRIQIEAYFHNALNKHGTILLASGEQIDPGPRPGGLAKRRGSGYVIQQKRAEVLQHSGPRHGMEVWASPPVEVKALAQTFPMEDP